MHECICTMGAAFCVERVHHCHDRNQSHCPVRVKGGLAPLLQKDSNGQSCLWGL